MNFFFHIWNDWIWNIYIYISTSIPCLFLFLSKQMKKIMAEKVVFHSTFFPCSFFPNILMPCSHILEFLFYTKVIYRTLISTTSSNLISNSNRYSYQKSKHFLFYSHLWKTRSHLTISRGMVYIYKIYSNTTFSDL